MYLTYVTVDDAIAKILESGPNTLLAKVDILPTANTPSR